MFSFKLFSFLQLTLSMKQSVSCNLNNIMKDYLIFAFIVCVLSFSHLIIFFNNEYLIPILF